MNKTAIVTGTGMDSKTLTHYLISKNYNVIMTYRRNTLFDTENIVSLYADDLKKYPEAKLDFVFLDNLDPISITNSIKYALEKYGELHEFYHLAAQSHVGDSFKNALYSINCNSLSAYYILDSIKEYTKKTKFYFANTSECFGGNPDNCPFTEKSPQELRSPYSLGKNLGAKITDYFRETHGIYACYGWLFNHSNYYRHESFYCAKIVKSALRISLGKQTELKLGNINHWRDEHFSDFGCEMMVKMLNNPLGPKNYVIGNGACNHGEEYLDEAFGFFNLNWKDYVKFDKSLERPNEVVKLLSSPRQAINDLDWTPNRISFKQHISLMCEYFSNLEKGIVKRPDVFS